MKITRKQLRQLIKEATAETEKKVTLSDGNEYTVHCSDEFVTKCSTGSCEPPISFTDFDGEDLKTITGACPIKMNENSNMKRTINEANITPKATKLINWLKSAGISNDDAYSALSDWQAREGEKNMKAITFFITRNTDMHEDWKGVLSALPDFRHDDYGNGIKAGLLKFLDDAWTGAQPHGYGKKLSGRTASLREGSLKITRKQLRQIIKEEFSRLNEADVKDERGKVNNVTLRITHREIEGSQYWGYELGYNDGVEDMGNWKEGEQIPSISLQGIVDEIKKEMNKQ